MALGWDSRTHGIGCGVGRNRQPGTSPSLGLMADVTSALTLWQYLSSICLWGSSAGPRAPCPAAAPVGMWPPHTGSQAHHLCWGHHARVHGRDTWLNPSPDASTEATTHPHPNPDSVSLRAGRPLCPVLYATCLYSSISIVTCNTNKTVYGGHTCLSHPCTPGRALYLRGARRPAPPPWAAVRDWQSELQCFQTGLFCSIGKWKQSLR